MIALHSIRGSPTRLEVLGGGMSAASVTRVSFGTTSVVVKASPSERETLVYERAGAGLIQAGVAMPRCIWSGRHDGLHWLILEDIPTPAPIRPRQNWRPDRRMVRLLARLHTLTLDLPENLTALAEPSWTSLASEAALSFFEPEIARHIRVPLRILQEEGQHVLEPWCWIQGDPNPANWGIRADGTLALYDWERFRRGAPAVDLAILITGMGDAGAYESLAGCYLAEWSALTTEPPWRVESLARDIALAKAWVMVSFLGMCVRGADRVPERLRGQLVEFVPPWIQDIARAR